MKLYALCPRCCRWYPITAADRFPQHHPDGRKNDGGVVPPSPRCLGSALPSTDALATAELTGPSRFGASS